MHKTASRPQWIWTSFEHVKNVPDKDEVAAKKFDGPYNFFNVNCKDDCPEVNATPPRQFWQPDPALQLKFKDAKFKSQIVRETPLTDAAKNMNKIFHSMLKGTVWENYMLLSTQWPSVFELHVAALSKFRCASAQDRFSEAAGHDLFAGADIPGELHAGNLQPGRHSARLVELHRLSRQCGGLSNARVEPKACERASKSVGLHVHAGEGAVGEFVAGRCERNCKI